jgi:hypothetical protein
MGLGTGSPTNPLHISTSDGTPIKLQSSGANTYINFVNSNNGQGYIGYETQDMVFWTANSERARIDSSGRLLVGTSSARTIAGYNVWRGLQVAGNTGNEAIINERYSNDSGGPHIFLGKSRGSTVGTYTVVQNGDGLGQISWCGADGTDMSPIAASIIARVDGTPGSNDMPGRLVFSTTADGASSPTERMTIKQDGKIGINVTNPSENLQVDNTLLLGSSNSSGSAIKFTRSGQTSAGQVTSDASSNLLIETSGSERVRIASNGAIGLSGANYGSSGQVITSNGSGSAPTWQTVSSGSLTMDKYVIFQNNGSIISSDGISSVSNTASGRYTINFSGNMNNANYLLLSTGRNYSTDQNERSLTIYSTSTSSCDVALVANNNGGPNDNGGHCAFYNT